MEYKNVNFKETLETMTLMKYKFVIILSIRSIYNVWINEQEYII